MKKVILSLGALLAVSVASAQSYPKQPDKTIVQYTSYYKEPAKEKKTEAEAKPEASVSKDTKAANAQPADKDVKLKKQEAVMPKDSKTGVAATEPRS